MCLQPHGNVDLGGMISAASASREGYPITPRTNTPSCTTFEHFWQFWAIWFTISGSEDFQGCKLILEVEWSWTGYCYAGKYLEAWWSWFHRIRHIKNSSQLRAGCMQDTRAGSALRTFREPVLPFSPASCSILQWVRLIFTSNNSCWDRNQTFSKLSVVFCFCWQLQYTRLRNTPPQIRLWFRRPSRPAISTAMATYTGLVSEWEYISNVLRPCLPKSLEDMMTSKVYA